MNFGMVSDLRRNQQSMRCETTRKLTFSSSPATPSSSIWNSSYDGYGNVTSETDPVGNRTDHVYDSAYQYFETETRLPPYTRSTSPDSRFKITTTRNTVCGAPLTVTDFNAQVSSIAYDPLCRTTRQDQPGGNFATVSYNNVGIPAAQFIETQSLAPGPSTTATIWSRQFLDGFGRAYQAKSQGPTATQTEIAAIIDYDFRGTVRRTSAPAYNGDPAQYTAYGYDALDRLIKITNPDSTIVTVTPGLAAAASADTITMSATDEAGLTQIYAYDGHGDLTKRTKMKGATPLLTEYQRDSLGRVNKIIDPNLNQWTMPPAHHVMHSGGT